MTDERIIDRTVDWLVSHLRLAPGRQVIDLGCGPGLYCARLSQRGLAGAPASPGGECLGVVARRVQGG